MVNNVWYVLSLLQPWASLIVAGHKAIETRPWKITEEKLLEVQQSLGNGRILIHASQGKSGRTHSVLDPFTKYIKDFDELPFGKVVGSVVLNGFMKSDDYLHGPQPSQTIMWTREKIKEEAAFGDFSPGRCLWFVKEPIKFDHPFPAIGSLGLWKMPADYYNQFYRG